jgi:hypothetical protein
MPSALRKALETLTTADAKLVLRWLELDDKPITKILAVVAVRAL